MPKTYPVSDAQAAHLATFAELLDTKMGAFKAEASAHQQVFKTRMEQTQAKANAVLAEEQERIKELVSGWLDVDLEGEAIRFDVDEKTITIGSEEAPAEPDNGSKPAPTPTPEPEASAV